MWNAARGAGLVRIVALLAASCASVLVVEACRDNPESAFTRLCGGLGTSGQVGVDAGWFAFDARLESLPDSALGPLPGVPATAGAGGGGVLRLAPLPTRASR